MSKRKKIDSSRIVLPSILIFFTTILILSLPVLLNYNSIQNIIEKKVSSEFKINLKILDDIYLKIFPRPHYLVKRANLNLNIENGKFGIVVKKENNIIPEVITPKGKNPVTLEFRGVTIKIIGKE